MIKKYRKKPVVIQAVQWTVNIEAEEAITKMGCKFKPVDMTDYILIETLEGIMRCDPWDYIIKGVKGEFYPCKPDIFEMSYEEVENE